MDCKSQITVLFNEGRWDELIAHIKAVLPEYPLDVDLHISAIYALHLALVDYFYTETFETEAKKMIPEIFNDSTKKFKENLEFQFFIGKLLYIAEWYFGINEYMKPLNDRLAFKMQEKAYKTEPENLLFRWAYNLSLGNPEEITLARTILNTPAIMHWLENKGVQGNYIIESLNGSIRRSGIVH